MRLLFIYFYKTKGTFKEGTVIELSKKYKVKHNGKFKFRLIKRDSFQDDFYGDNIDIGAIIGENGTGKSVLINSLRDGENNYSLAVYEKGDGEFFYDGDFEGEVYIYRAFKIKWSNTIVHLNLIDFQYHYNKFCQNNIKPLVDTTFIYYSSIMDMFDFKKESLIDISDKQIFMDNDKYDFLSKILIMDNQDVSKYFSIKNNLLDKYLKIENLKLNNNSDFFEELSKKLDKKLSKQDLDEVFSLVKRLNKQEVLNFLHQKTSELNDDDIKRNIHSYIDNDLQVFVSLILDDLNLIKKNFENLDKLLLKKYENNDRELLEIKNFINENKNSIIAKINMKHIIDFLNNRKEDYCHPAYIMDFIIRNEHMMFYFKQNDYIVIEQKLLDYFREKKIGYDKSYILYNLEKNIYSIILEQINMLDNDKKLFLEKLIYFQQIDMVSSKYSQLILQKKIHFIRIDYRLLIPKMFYLQKLEKTILMSWSKDIIVNFLKKLFLYPTNFQKELFILSLKYKRDINKKLKIRLQNILSYLYIQEDISDLVKKFPLEKIEYDNQENLIETLISHFNLYNEDVVLLNNKILKSKEDIKINIDKEFFKNYENTIKKSIRPFTYELNPPLSSGQKAILFIFARIDNAIKQIESDNIIILLDEADLKLHLEWQRQFINDLVEFLKSYPNKNFYVLYATHSPMILSDITDDRIVFLKKEGDYSIDKSINEKKSTFGANIYDLYHDSFFMDRYMGEFAFNKINDVINIVNLYKVVVELDDDKEQERLKDYERIYNFNKLFKSYILYYPQSDIDSQNLYEKREEIKSNIETQKEQLKSIARFIGEPLLRNKLEDDLNNIGREFNIDEVVESLKDLSQKEIKEKLSKYSESIQMKILKKLFASGA